MKKARVIVFPDDRPLTTKEFNDYKNHALNSSLWYASTYSRNSGQVQEKLTSKGYPEGLVKYINNSGEIQEYDFIATTIQKLIEADVVNDERYATSFIESKLRQGWGLSKIKFELVNKKLDSKFVDEILEKNNYDNEVVDGIHKVIQRTIKTSSYSKLEPTKQRIKLTQVLMSKGYSYVDIKNVLDELKDDE